ncbi:C2H2-type domain-containing protein [Trichostrongylus colubriformis]|uniref:C2H2-type domain-containing protein n=1 Tax=Trichostrongylus colubriformis TaxID=6319 RepID=A0AAN8IZ44_TRICO
MGRRKQAKPTKRIPDEFEVAEMEPSAKIARDTSSTHSATANSPAQDNVESSPSCSKDPASADLSSTAESLSPSAKKPPANPLLMLEKSLKRFEPRKSQSAVQQPRLQSNPFSSGLGALFQFVGKLHGESMLNAPQRRDTDVDSILKCLQCGRMFQTMEMLVRHMQDTQHFNNLPKTYSSIIQMDRQKVLNLKLQMKSDGVKLACIKCGEIPTNIDKHLKEVHDVKTSSDWLKNIRIVRDGENQVSSLPHSAQAPANSPHLNKLMSLINTVDKK